MVTYPSNGRITWKGITWDVRDYGTPTDGNGDPGPNYWNGQGVYIDDDGALHTTIQYVSSHWRCSEIDSPTTYGYGKYRFTIASGTTNLLTLDRNCVVGPFLYGDETNALTAEFSYWKNEYTELLVDTNQPSPEHHVNIPSQPIIVQIEFTATYVRFQVWKMDGTLVDTWTNSSHIPTQNQYIILQAWLIDGLAPSNGQPVDVKYLDFLINPTSDPAKTPVAAFTATPTSGSAPRSVAFTDQSTNTPTSWNWDFGDGTTHGTTQNPSHTYSTPGTYTVTLTATNAAGSDSEIKTGYITVSSATVTPVAQFTANVTSGTAPVTVQFTDTSTNTPTSWNWDFGDGTTHGTTQNPSHQYTVAGTYTVTLTATNSAGSDSEIKTGYITIVAPSTSPVAHFTYSAQTGTAPFAVQFTDISTGSPTSWNWDFGDGTTHGTTQNPSHTYSTPGTYTVSLTVANGAQNSTETKSGLIGIYRAGDPVSNPYISHVLNGTFDNWTNGNPDNWTVKPGYTGHSQSSEHKIGTSSLRITGRTDQEYRGWIWQSVTTGENYTKAGCWIKITGLTQGAVRIVLWDGTAERRKNFTHNCDWRWVEWRIPYTDAYVDAEIDIYSYDYLNSGAEVFINGLVFSKDYTLTMTEADTGTAINKTLTYNPGAVYSNATILVKYDEFDIGCYETGTCTCTVDTVSHAVTFNPFTPGGQIWLDGSSLTNASHTIVISTSYSRSGHYVTNGVLQWKGVNWDCRTGQGAPVYNRWDPYGVYVDYFNRLHLTIKNYKEVWFSSEVDCTERFTYGKITWVVDQEALNLDKNTVVGLFTYLNDTNEHDIEFSTWEDAYTENVWFSNQPNALYSVASYPSEKVTCTIDWKPTFCRFSAVTESGVTLADYTDSVHLSSLAQGFAMNLWLYEKPSNLAEIDIIIYDFSLELYTEPIADFFASVASGTTTTLIQFTDASDRTPTSWLWNFGDGATSTDQNPSHSYANAGTYTVSLTATNAYGNDTLTRTNYITISTSGTNPVAHFTATTHNSSLTVDFTDTSTNTPIYWNWDFGDGATSTDKSPTHTYTVSGTYTVTLTVTNDSGAGVYVSRVTVRKTAPTVSTAYINDKQLRYQAKEVNPSKRLAKSETPGRYGCAIDDLGEGGLDITIDVTAIGESPSAALLERDQIVAAFMQSGTSIYNPGGIDEGWHYTGICGDRTSSLKLNKDLPTRGYPMSFLFCTDTPFMESDVQHSRGRYIPYSYFEWSDDDNIPGNLCKNYSFELWTNGTTNAVPDLWKSVGSATGYRANEGYIGSYSYGISGNGTSEVAGWITQHVQMQKGTTYKIAARVKITGLTHGYVVLSLKDPSGTNYVEYDCFEDTEGWQWIETNYACEETPLYGEINVGAMGYPNSGSTILFDNVVFMEVDGFENSTFGNPITAYGTVDATPDIELIAGFTSSNGATAGTSHEINSTSSGSTKTSSAYQSFTTITIPALSGIRNRIDAVGFTFRASSSYSGRKAWGKVTIQAAHMYNNVETTMCEYSTSSTDYVVKLSSLSQTNSQANEAIVVRFYYKTENSSYAAYMKNPVVDYTEIGSVVSLPTNISVYNLDDPTQICKICNKLYPNTRHKINADGTGSFDYIDNFLDNSYIGFVASTTGTVTYDTTNNLINMMSGAILNLIIEIPYPIVGVPTLDMSVLGNMHVSIGTDNVTYYLTEIDPAWEDYWRMIKYKLNCSSLQLAGRTVFYVRISSGGNNNKISSIYLHCDTETIDAQKISIANGSTSTFKILSTGQMDCFLNMYYHDRKWGI